MFAYVVIRSKTDVHGLMGFPELIGGPMDGVSWIISLMGCVMLLLAKTQYGIDNTVAGGIVGAGLGILTKKSVPTSPSKKKAHSACSPQSLTQSRHLPPRVR